MSQKITVLSFYLIFAIIYTFGFLHNFIVCRFDGTDLLQSVKDKMHYLTVWNYCLQSVYFLLCTLNALNSLFSKTTDSLLNRLCNRLYTSWVFPIGMIVVFTFWIIYAIDRELVFPEVYDKIIPQWQNQIMHTLPLITSILDSYLVHHPYPSFMSGASLAALFGLAYLIFTFYVAYFYGIWLYPFLRLLGMSYRIGFFAALAVILIGIYSTGKSINSFFWSNKSKKQKAKKIK